MMRVDRTSPRIRSRIGEAAFRTFHRASESAPVATFTSRASFTSPAAFSAKATTSSRRSPSNSQRRMARRFSGSCRVTSIADPRTRSIIVLSITSRVLGPRGRRAWTARFVFSRSSKYMRTRLTSAGRRITLSFASVTIASVPSLPTIRRFMSNRGSYRW